MITAATVSAFTSNSRSFKDSSALAMPELYFVLLPGTEY